MEKMLRSIAQSKWTQDAIFFSGEIRRKKKILTKKKVRS